MSHNHDKIPLGLSFDDVLLLPQSSSIESRAAVSTRSQLVRDIYLETPIISSNMDTVTMSDMNIAMSKAGAIGIIHRFLSIDEAVKEAKRVKRYRAHVIEDPYEITADKSIAEAEAEMDLHEIGGLMVVNNTGKLIGIITRRDIYSEPPDQRVKEAMTPYSKMITAAPNIGSSKASKLMHDKRVEKLPLVNKARHATGLIVMKDIRKLQDYPKSALDSRGRLLVGSSIGVIGDYVERAEELTKYSDFLAIDVAHGHASHVIKATKKIHRQFPDTPLIVGDVATPEGFTALVKAGASAVRVGIGPGSICATRIVSGSGRAQLTSILECAKAAKKLKIPLIADGGIKSSADLTKAIGAGASTVILGSLLAGTPESPGKIILKENGDKYKKYRGMASVEAMLDKKISEGFTEEEFETTNVTASEGIEPLIKLKPNAEIVINQLMGGLRSGMSYSNSKDIETFHRKAQFERITQGGQAEGRTHILER